MTSWLPSGVAVITGFSRTDLRHRPAVIAAAIAAVAACWIVSLHLRRAAFLPGSRFDAAWEARIDGHRTPTRDLVAHTVATIGRPPVSIVITALVALAIALARGWAAGTVFTVAAAADELDVLALKREARRPTPGASLLQGFGSFPSGHTAKAAVIAVSVALLSGRLLMGGGFGRRDGDRSEVCGCPLTDTVAGAVVGAAVTMLV